MKIRIHRTEEKVRSLGPGVRYVVWVQGCMRRCPGCMSPSGQSLDGGYEMDTDALAERILASGCDGVTISGGEPFLQAAALVSLIQTIREKKDLGIIIYTGNTYEELEKNGNLDQKELLTCCDLLIDGEYREELNDGKSLRGSSNQRVIPLTTRYEKDLCLYGTQDTRVELVFSEDGLRLIGVPTRKMEKILYGMMG